MYIIIQNQMNVVDVGETTRSRFRHRLMTSSLNEVLAVLGTREPPVTRRHPSLSSFERLVMGLVSTVSVYRTVLHIASVSKLKRERTATIKDKQGALIDKAAHGDDDHQSTRPLALQPRSDGHPTSPSSNS